MTPLQMVSGGLMTVEEARRALGGQKKPVSNDFIYGLMNSGELAFTYTGRIRKIPVLAVQQYLAKNLRGGGYVAEAGARKPRMRRRVARRAM